MNSDQKWEKHLQKNPDLVMRKIIQFFATHGDPKTLMEMSKRLLDGVNDEYKRAEAGFWREKLITKVRKVVNRYNKDLNKVTRRIRSLKPDQTPVTVDMGPNVDLGPNDDDDDDSDFDHTYGTEDAKRATGPTVHLVDGKESIAVVETELFGNSSENNVSESEDANDGPNDEDDNVGSNDEAANDGPNDEDTANNVLAEQDYWDTKYMPKTDAKKARFLRLYPAGYPDDKNFSKLPHYIESARSKSGYKHVGSAEAKRTEKWRVKADSITKGRYYKLAKACEVAYWVDKNKKDEDAFLKRDTVPEAMFE